MSHFPVVVLANDGQTVEELLDPYDENGEWFANGSRWDWWVVGGRFTGALTSYDPTSDPDNYRRCDYCEKGKVTKRIAKKYPAYEDSVGETCIQCKGTTRLLKLAFDWKKYDKDILPVRDLDLDAMRWIPSAIVTPDGEWHEQGRVGWFGYVEDPKTEEAWRAEVETMFAAHPNATATLVDCHV